VNNMAAAASDVNEVFSRLFDHRPFLRGEIEFFKKEFEEKRGDREVEQLFRSLELITEIKEGQIEKIVNSSDDNLPRTIADVQVALHMCEDTLDTESKFNCFFPGRTACKKESRKKCQTYSCATGCTRKVKTFAR
ncbi:hypothetical protein OTU49_011144, partial [Cherax quadricarinatus]